MTVKFDPRHLPNGTVLVLGVRYLPGTEPGGDTRGRTKPTTYTYAALKTGGLWYLTGSGKVPQAAGWGAVERWLARDNRQLVHADYMTRDVRLWDELDHRTEPVVVAEETDPAAQEPSHYDLPG